MKQLLLIILGLVCLDNCKAQIFNSMYLNIGKGVAPEEYHPTFKGVEGPLTISLDKKCLPFLYIGTLISHKKVGLLDAVDPDKIVGTDLLIGFRGSLHLRNSKSLKIYAGGMHGFRFLIAKKNTIIFDNLTKLISKKLNSKSFNSFHLGIRHYPKTWFGYFAELSNGNAIMTLGFSIQL